MTKEEIQKFQTALKNIKQTISNEEDKNFKLLFFVADSKGVPIGSLAYTYGLAKMCQDLGYDVRMLYADKDFVGVEKWLGPEYSTLKHYDTTKENIDVNASDFLFMPELLSNIMTKTKDLPCKKIALLEDWGYFVDTIPLGSTWEKLGIYDCITTSEFMKERIKTIFPKLNVFVIPPFIDDVFNIDESDNTPKMIVNIISKDERNINAIVKPFKWRYPVYNFVSFRYINGRSHEEMAKFLKEGNISVWIDSDTDFGYSALEAMACGNIVIGKIPDSIPEWMKEGNEFADNGLWFYNINDLPKILADVIQSSLYNKIPQIVHEKSTETIKKYRKENITETLNKCINEWMVGRRIEELTKFKKEIENNLEENKE